MADKSSNPPPLSIAPSINSKLDPSYVRRTLSDLKKGQASQREIEAERTGASKLTAKLLTFFGTVITAAAIGGFVWVWDAQAANHRQDAEIVHFEERMHSHDPAPAGHEDLEASVLENSRRIAAANSEARVIKTRLDAFERQQATRHAELIAELRRLRTARRTW